MPKDFKKILFPLLHHSQRYPWVAALASLAVPGLGQLYAGFGLRGLILLTAVFLFRVGWSNIALSFDDAQILSVVMAVTTLDFIIGLLVMLDAFILAKRNRPVHLPFQNWYVYLGLFTVWYYIPTQTDFLLIETRNIPSASMAPTLLIGDHVLVDKRINCVRCVHPIQRGDIVVFHREDPKKDDTAYIKRVIGLPGDVIEVKNRRYIINGQALEYTPVDGSQVEIPPLLLSQLNQPEAIEENILGTRHLILWDKVAQARDVQDRVEVPAGFIYVMGDNRQHSHDSRFYGPIPVRRVVGRARVIYFHSSEEKTSFWHRFGTIL